MVIPTCEPDECHSSLPDRTLAHYVVRPYIYPPNPMSPSKPSILINGFYGYQNLGDEAMLAGLVWRLRQGDANRDRPITVLSGNPKDSQQRHRVNTFPPLAHRSKKELLRNASQSYLRTLWQCKLLILGGGDLLRDGVDYDVAGRWVRSVQDAQRLGRKTAIVGVSVGEIWKPETQKLIPKVLNSVELIAVRDRLSQSRLQDLGVRPPIHLMADMALWGLPEISTQASPETPPQIGISLRLLSNRGQGAGAIDIDRFRQQMAQVLDHLVEHHGAIVHLLPFQSFANAYHPADDDYLAALEVLRYCRQSPQFVVHRHLGSLGELQARLASLDLVIAMRLHGLILAAGLGVPAIAASYDPKVTGFMTELGQADRCFELGEFEADRVCGIADGILADRAGARAGVERDLAAYKERSAGFEAEFQRLLDGL
jgi:polysaccharide pyruvyl transferase CsaB